MTIKATNKLGAGTNKLHWPGRRQLRHSKEQVRGEYAVKHG